jgi:hypothetical protein
MIPVRPARHDWRFEVGGAVVMSYAMLLMVDGSAALRLITAAALIMAAIGASAIMRHAPSIIVTSHSFEALASAACLFLMPMPSGARGGGEAVESTGMHGMAVMPGSLLTTVCVLFCTAAALGAAARAVGYSGKRSPRGLALAPGASAAMLAAMPLVMLA